MKFLKFIIYLGLVSCSGLRPIPIAYIPELKNLNSGINIGPVLNKPLHVYPKALLGIGQEGWVVVQFDLKKSGKTENVKYLKFHPISGFEFSAEEYVKNSVYEPYISNGKKVRLNNVKTVVFFEVEETEG